MPRAPGRVAAMTTMGGAFALFMAMLTVGLTVASLWRGGVTRPHRAPVAVPAVSARPTTRADLSWDYCAGHDGVVLRKAMRWTADGEWRCRECAPPTETELAEHYTVGPHPFSNA